MVVDICQGCVSVWSVVWRAGSWLIRFVDSLVSLTLSLKSSVILASRMRLSTSVKRSRASKTKTGLEELEQMRCRTIKSRWCGEWWWYLKRSASRGSIHTFCQASKLHVIFSISIPYHLTFTFTWLLPSASSLSLSNNNFLTLDLSETDDLRTIWLDWDFFKFSEQEMIRVPTERS